MTSAYDINRNNRPEVQGYMPDWGTLYERFKNKELGKDAMDIIQKGIVDDYNSNPDLQKLVHGVGDFYQDLRTVEGEEKYKKFTSTYKVLTKWWAKQHQYGRKNNYVKTGMGRVQPLPDINSDDFRFKSKDERKAVNGPVQGTSADITKLAMSLIYRAVKQRNWFDKLHMILTVHDEIVFEIHGSILEEAIEIVLREARSNGIGGLADDKTHEAASVVEDFFVNNVFDGTEEY